MRMSRRILDGAEDRFLRCRVTPGVAVPVPRHCDRRSPKIGVVPVWRGALLPTLVSTSGGGTVVVSAGSRGEDRQRLPPAHGRRARLLRVVPVDLPFGEAGEDLLEGDAQFESG